MAWPTETETDRRTYLPPLPGPEQAAAIAELHEGARLYCRLILTSTPQCGDQSAAIRKTVEAMDAACAAVQCSSAEAREKWLNRQPMSAHIYREAEAAELARGPNCYRPPARGGL